ncbi:MAG: class B sortase [Eubacteriales bacterium]|nr:class B sortase [Eubacteriales bacterium]
MAKEKPKKNKMSLAGKIVFVISLVLLIVSLGIIIDHYLKGQKSEKEFSALKVSDTYDLDALYRQNSDIIGWIKIEDTKIDYPVMQTKSRPEFYLRRNFKKEYSLSGTPFMDAASDINTPTKNWLIYGHNMKNGTMFHDILDYEDAGFYEEHKTFTFDTIEEEGKWEVVAVFRSKIYKKNSDKFKYYEYGGIVSGEQLKEYVRICRSLSQYDTGVEVNEDDIVLTLSTCAYHTKDGRFAVVAKKIK